MAKSKFATIDRREKHITYEFEAPSYEKRKYVVLLEATSRNRGTVSVWRIEPRKFLWFNYNKRVIVATVKVEDIVKDIKAYSSEFSYENNRDYWARILQTAFDDVIASERYAIERKYEHDIRIQKGYAQKLGS
jgi:hypothetical protein